VKEDKDMNSSNSTVIYTAIFGGKDELQNPTFVPPGCDFVCFTDAEIKSSVWQIRKPIFDSFDPVRRARQHKVLAHKLFPEYKHSVWVDGNIIVRGDVNKLIEKHLTSSHMAIYDHVKTVGDSRDCVYDEAAAIIEMGKNGKYKDDPKLIEEQIARYKKEGYPSHHGLISSMELVRKHNEKDVADCMELWWSEIAKGSRRDQLSFNYAAWKLDFKPAIISEDSRNNEFFLHTAHKKKDYFDSK
jgi:hypothetical protein